MEIKLFGRKLFEFNAKSGDAYSVPSLEKVAELKHLPDFKTIGNGGNWQSDEVIQWVSTATIGTPNDKALVKIEDKPKKEKTKLSPKKVYDLKMLHNMGFSINMEAKYVDEQIADFKSKLGLLKEPSYNHRGFDEIGSILIRMENRKKYASVKNTFEKFPYTTNQRIENVIKKHDYLKLGEIDQFVADLPKEATDTMKEYNSATQKICGKNAVFYIIADKKDFEKTSSRRDPILLAQSPFGHFWQILGVWEKEMLFLEEL